MDFPKVSVITVVYNSKEALERTINSVASLNYPNLEYVIIDGASQDGTKRVIEDNYLKITRWISEPDKGIYDAMNKGMKLATGNYVWFMNAGDTVYDPNILFDIFKGKECYSDFYYGETLVVDPCGEVLGLRAKRLPRVLRWTSFRRGMSVCHQSMIVSRTVVEPYDLHYRFSADIDWTIKILKKGVSTYKVNKIISVFEHGGVSTQNHKASLKERWAIMLKHYGLVQTTFSHITFCFNIFKPKFRKYKNER